MKYRCANVIATTGSTHVNTTLLAATTGTRASNGRTRSTTVRVTRNARRLRKNSRQPPTFATKFGMSLLWWPTRTASHSNRLRSLTRRPLNITATILVKAMRHQQCYYRRSVNLQLLLFLLNLLIYFNNKIYNSLMVIFLIYYYIIYNEILYLFHFKKKHSDIHLLKILFFFNFKPFKKKQSLKN